VVNLSGVAIQGGTDLWRGHYSGWRSYVAAGVSGAATGEAALYLGPAGAGAVGGFTHAATEQALNGEFKPGALAGETILSAAGGKVGEKVLSAAGNAIAESQVGTWVSEQVSDRAGAVWDSVAARLARSGCSFAESTAVTTPDGLTPIRELHVGDRVLARSEETGIYAFEPITKVFRHQDPVKVHLTLEDPATGATEVIETTPKHPFHVPGRGFVPAALLMPDDSVSRAPSNEPAPTSVVRLMSVRSDTSEVLRVKTLTFDNQPFWAYNLEVGQDHTFFVGVERAWVHNACSILLGNNLVKAGFVRQANDQAHHIVAGTATRAAPAQAILRRVGIDIDAAENGVFLPKVATGGTASVHNGGHTNAYYDAVNNALAKFANAGPADKQQVINALAALRNDLLNGNLKIGR
jgi:hypothetical protein